MKPQRIKLNELKRPERGLIIPLFKNSNISTISKYDDYLYEMEFKDLDYEFARKYYEGDNQPCDCIFGCSSIRNGNLYGRNLDWTYNNDVSIFVKVPATEGRYATKGMSCIIPGIDRASMESGFITDNFELIPFRIVDGVNEKGLFCNVNVTPHLEGFIKTDVDGAECNLSIRLVTRYILDHFTTADEAIAGLKKINIYTDDGLISLGYDSHWMVGDSNKTYIVEIVNKNGKYVIDAKEWNYMTNFSVIGTTLNEDNMVYTPETQDNSHNAIDTNKIAPLGAGLERWNLIVNNYNSLNNKDNMVSIMRDTLNYNNAYTLTENKWYTEFVGDYNNIHYTCATPKNIFEFPMAEGHPSIMELTKDQFEHRTREDGNTWHTTHTSVYDFENKKLYVYSPSEDNIEYNFDL